MRFELTGIEKRDGVVHIAVTAFHKIAGSEVLVGANTQCTETVWNHYWRYKDGQLYTMNNELEWAEVSERNPETDFAMAAIKAQGYER